MPLISGVIARPEVCRVELLRRAVAASPEMGFGNSFGNKGPTQRGRESISVVREGARSLPTGFESEMPATGGTLRGCSCTSPVWQPVDRSGGEGSPVTSAIARSRWQRSPLCPHGVKGEGGIRVGVRVVLLVVQILLTPRRPLPVDG